MARPRSETLPPPSRDAKSEPVGKGEHLKPYDKYLIRVDRKVVNVRDGQTGQRRQVSKTIGVYIDMLVRKNVKLTEKIATVQNISQDHQNPCEGGKPIVQWYFPAETVKMGQYYKAKDHEAAMNEDDEQDEISAAMCKVVGTKNEPAKYLVIDTRKEAEAPSMQ